MSETRYTEDHEYVRMETDDEGVVGITDYAQEQLGEIVFVELPEVGLEAEQAAECAVIESVKAAGEVKAPVGGTVLAVNEALADEPERVNRDPAGEGWIMRLKIADPGELDALMDDAAYQEYVQGLG